MTIQGFGLLVVWVGAVAGAWLLIRDIMSPDKLMLGVLGAFFANIFFGDYDGEIYVIYLIMLIATFAIAAAAAAHRRSKGQRALLVRTYNGANRVQAVLGPSQHLLMWVASVPALSAQAYLIARAGGIGGYINLIGFRVVEYRGLGVVLLLVATFSIVNVVYFCLLVSDRRRQPAGTGLYCLHLLIMVLLGLLSGSRGALLANFVLMAMAYHYTVRRIGVSFVVSLVAAMLFTASVLEIARSGYSYGPDGFTTGLSDTRASGRTLGFAWAEYGLLPLQLLLDADRVDAKLGATYLTVATNVVPRALWPGKPDTGGVVLTKEYADNRWHGSSYLATGIMPEAILNFGPTLGVAWGVASLTALLGWLLGKYYQVTTLLLRVRSRRSIFTGIRFVYLVWGAMSLIVGEFTNVVISVVFAVAVVTILETALRVVAAFRLPPDADSGRAVHPLAAPTT